MARSLSRIVWCFAHLSFGTSLSCTSVLTESGVRLCAHGAGVCFRFVLWMHDTTHTKPWTHALSHASVSCQWQARHQQGAVLLQS